MQKNRREFIVNGIKTTALTSTLTALSYKNVLGSNEQIRVGMIGCGGRGRWHIGWLHRTSVSMPVSIIAVCDIWDQNRKLGSDEVEKRFEEKPKAYQNHEDLLSNPDIDAVVIATPDHHHCPHLIDAVNAGKDVYVEKPIATTLEELKKAYDVVTQSKQIVQNGTQGRSSKGALAAKEFIQSGQLGKVIRVEESRSHYVPYWNNYGKPESEKETDWNEFLADREARPFDPDRHGSWMGYKEYSPNTIGGWMSHFSDFVHFATDCGYPVSSVSHGGIYSPTSVDVRTCPDTVTAIVDYPEGFSTLFTTHFGNGANNYTMFFGTKGVMRIGDPDGNVNGIQPLVSGEGSEHPNRIEGETLLPEIPQKDHMENWLECIQTRKQPNANMEQGYKQGVAVLLAEAARLEERKMLYVHDEKVFKHS